MAISFIRCGRHGLLPRSTISRFGGTEVEDPGIRKGAFIEKAVHSRYSAASTPAIARSRSSKGPLKTEEDDAPISSAMFLTSTQLKTLPPDHKRLARGRLDKKAQQSLRSKCTASEHLTLQPERRHMRPNECETFPHTSTAHQDRSTSKADQEKRPQDCASTGLWRQEKAGHEGDATME